jgi:DNA helicase HerA-like ATPase
LLRLDIGAVGHLGYRRKKGDVSMASDPILLGAGSGGANPQLLLLNRANRHGLIAGATGTGKTVTLQRIAEGFSAAGVPVFMADVKGDLAGLAMAGAPTDRTHEAFAKRAADLGIADYSNADFPVTFWDLYGEKGHPVRATVTEMGPLLLARLMGLNETQEGVLSIAFRVADEEGLLLLNLEDLQSLLSYCGERASELSTKYGNVTKPSVGTIQRELLQLESQGGDHFFGEPALAIPDLLAVDDQGRGTINILAADRLMADPKLYATFLLWLLSELFETLPEVGDPEKPRLVFFFDEAHLLFDDAPPALQEKIEQVVRLIRSKGVGVYFITQNPVDIPDTVAGQLGNRVQHALRAFTPKDQRAIKAAAETFRVNPAIDVTTAITELAVGEALVSLLRADGAPSPVERTLIAPPRSRVGPLTDKERAIMVSTSPVAGKYEQAVDRESAEEILHARAQAAADAQAAAQAKAQAEKEAAAQAKEAERAAAAQAKEQARLERERRANPSFTEEITRQFGKTVQRQLVNRVATSLIRGVLGGLLRGR